MYRFDMFPIATFPANTVKTTATVISAESVCHCVSQKALFLKFCFFLFLAQPSAGPRLKYHTPSGGFGARVQ
jgi:hypothetical protein